MAELAVLVADDDAPARRYFVDALASLGVRASEAASGADALAALARDAFDVVIADLRMPGPAGESLARAVRERPAARPPRLYAMSAELEAEQRSRLVAAGYADALTKPVSLARLAALLGVESGAPRDAGSIGTADPAAVVDDRAALAALGSEATVVAVRGLMRGDLPALRAGLDDDLRAGRHAAAAASLHRLRAACAFCGAPRLAAASIALQRALEQGRHDAVPLLHRDWDEAARELETALAQR